MVPHRRAGQILPVWFFEAMPQSVGETSIILRTMRTASERNFHVRWPRPTGDCAVERTPPHASYRPGTGRKKLRHRHFETKRTATQKTLVPTLQRGSGPLAAPRHASSTTEAKLGPFLIAFRRNLGSIPMLAILHNLFPRLTLLFKWVRFVFFVRGDFVPDVFASLVLGLLPSVPHSSVFASVASFAAYSMKSGGFVRHIFRSALASFAASLRGEMGSFRKKAASSDRSCPQASCDKCFASMASFSLHRETQPMARDFGFVRQNSTEGRWVRSAHFARASVASFAVFLTTLVS